MLCVSLRVKTNIVLTSSYNVNLEYCNSIHRIQYTYNTHYSIYVLYYTRYHGYYYNLMYCHIISLDYFYALSIIK